MKTYLILKPNGEFETFSNDFSLNGNVQRVSYIRPQNIFLRIIFIFIRWIVNDNSKIANWTRQWKCKWVVQLKTDRKIYKNFINRDDAILFERKIIVNQKIKENG
jgi:hypothetical protein